MSCLLTPVSHHQPCLQVLKTHLCLPLLPEFHFPCKSAVTNHNKSEYFLIEDYYIPVTCLLDK